MSINKKKNYIFTSADVDGMSSLLANFTVFFMDFTGLLGWDTGF